MAAKVDRLRKVWRAHWAPDSTVDAGILRSLAQLELKLAAAGQRRPDPCKLLTIPPKAKLDAMQKRTLAPARRVTAALLLKRCPNQARPFFAKLPVPATSGKARPELA